MPSLKRVMHAAIAAMIASAVPGFGATTFTNIFDSTSGLKQTGGLQINEQGEVAFITTDANGVEAVLRGSGGPHTTIIDSSGIYSNLSEVVPGINSNGVVAFFAASHKVVGGVYTGSGGPVTPYYTTATTSFTAFSSPWLNDSGVMAFTALNSDGLLGVYRGDGGLLTQIDYSVGVRNSFGYNPAINNSGQVAYTAFQIGVGPVIMRGDGAELITIAEGGNAPGTFFWINDPDISDSGKVVFRAVYNKPHLAKQGLFIGDGGPLQTIVDDTGLFEGFWLPSINNLDQVAFMATLDTTEKGIFVGTDALNDRVIMVGDSLFGSTVVDLSFAPGAYNSRQQLAFGYQLADGRSGVAVATVPEPGPAALLSLGAILLLQFRQRA